MSETSRRLEVEDAAEHELYMANLIVAAGFEAWGEAEEEMANPHFENAGRVHDWRNHTPDAIEKLWQHMSLEARLCAYMTADKAAGAEYWE